MSKGHLLPFIPSHKRVRIMYTTIHPSNMDGRIGRACYDTLQNVAVRLENHHGNSFRIFFFTRCFKNIQLLKTGVYLLECYFFRFGDFSVVFKTCISIKHRFINIRRSYFYDYVKMQFFLLALLL